MTAIAGMFSLKETIPLRDRHAEALCKAVSRHPGDTPAVFSSERFCLVKLDIGVFRTEGVIEEVGGAISLMAGEPILEHDSAGRIRTRTEDLAEFHAAWRSGDWASLARARGTFCAVHVEESRCALHLAVDRVGVRPLYYWSDGELVVFGSALRMIEELVPVAASVRGVTEVAAYGFALGDRTPYRDVVCMRAGTVVHLTAAGISCEPYSRWDETPQTEGDSDALAKKLYECFIEAVRLRLGADRASCSLLSGGLDSRAIVSALTELGSHPYTYNFSWDSTLDSVLGAQFADRVGATHSQSPLPPAEVGSGILRLIGPAVDQTEWLEGKVPDRPRFVWSGDGGSVGMGHTYLNEAIVERMREGDIRGAVAEFAKYNYTDLATAVLRPTMAERCAEIPRRGAREELEALHCPDAARNMFVFLLENDQRRHLFPHFEDIDLNRLELTQPFFDSKLLGMVVGSKIDPFLRHNLYLRWLREFPASVMEVPWQAYPGHVQCPLPMPEGLRTQWEMSKRESPRVLKRRMRARAREVLDSQYFPSALVDRRRLQLASWATGLGLRDYGYLIGTAQCYARYWDRSKGSYSDADVEGVE